MSQPTCQHCGGLHYGSLPGKCPYLYTICGKDIRPDVEDRCLHSSVSEVTPPAPDKTGKDFLNMFLEVENLPHLDPVMETVVLAAMAAFAQYRAAQPPAAGSQPKECRNPNHALVDGSPHPHEIGTSCMAEMSGAEKTLAAALASSEAELREMTKNARILEATIRLLRTETGSVEYWKSRAETAELKVLTFHNEICARAPESAEQDDEQFETEDEEAMRLLGEEIKKLEADLAEARQTIERLEKRLRKYECPTCGSDQRFHPGWVGIPLHCSDEFHNDLAHSAPGVQAEKDQRQG